MPPRRTRSVSKTRVDKRSKPSRDNSSPPPRNRSSGLQTPRRKPHTGDEGSTGGSGAEEAGPLALLQRVGQSISLSQSTPKSIKSFFAPLQRNRNKKQSNTAWQKLKSAMFGFFLLDKVEYKNLSVWVSTYHYIPVLALVFALTINCILFVFFSLVFPLMDDPGATEGLNAIGILFAHMGVLAGCTSIGYKTMSIIVDAMIDSCLVVIDPETEEQVFFYSLLMDLRIVLSSLPLTIVFISALSITAALFYMLIFNSMLGFAWESNDKGVFYIASATIVIGALYTVYRCAAHYLKHGSFDINSKEFTVLWGKLLPRLRRRSTLVAVITTVIFAIESGAVYGMSCMFEAMLYLMLPHLILCLCIKLTLYFEKLQSCWKTISHDERAFKMVKLLVFPWVFGAIGVGVFFFGKEKHHIALLQFPPLLTLFTSSVSLFRLEAGDANPGKTHLTLLPEEGEDGEGLNNKPLSPVTGTPAAPAKKQLSLGHMALKLYLLNTKDRFRRLPHFRAGLLVRILLRSILLTLHIFLVLLALWVSIQASPSFGVRQLPTSCQVDPENPNAINIYASALNAHLYGLEKHTRAENLVYEADPSLYDRKRYEGLCTRKWGNHLFAGDLAYFSILPYLNKAGLDNMFSFYKKYRDDASDWKNIPVEKKRGSAVFQHFTSDSKKLHVLSVRGTDTGDPYDFLQNVVIYAETFIFQMLALAVPGSSFIPERTIVDFIAAAGAIDAALLPRSGKQLLLEHHYHSYVEEYAAKLMNSSSAPSKQKGYSVLLVGHSLGGVVARIVGARLRVPAVAFAAPGISLMQKKFDISGDAIDAYTTTIIASNDLLAKIDKLGGSVEHIQCEFKRADICHSIELHTVRLWTMCPDFREKTRMNGTYAIIPQPHDRLMSAAQKYWYGEDDADGTEGV